MAHMSDAENLLEIMLVTRAQQETRVLQIDPIGCGCTECLTGLYVPLDAATDNQLLDMVMGKLGNATSMTWTQIQDWHFDRKRRLAGGKNNGR